MNRLTHAFPLWIATAALLAFWMPALFTWFSGPWITAGLATIMLCMGLTHRLSDFAQVLRTPRWVASGLILHYTLMPFLAWLIGRLLHLPDALAVGLILVGCCPSGTASNVICYLARANVAVSVTVTALSTMASIAMTPLLTAWLAGSRMPVDAGGLFLSTLEVVLLPVAGGLLLNRLWPATLETTKRASPLVAVLVIALIVGSIIGSQRTALIAAGPQLLLAVALLHLCGFLAGYVFARWINRNEQVARTISIEVGLQNSGLGAQLARANFPLGSGVDLPAALSALLQALIASAIAAWWQRRPVE